MGDCFLIGNLGGKKVPKPSGTASLSIVDEGSGNWHGTITGSGTITFPSNSGIKDGISVFMVGGGAAGATNGGYGGGGYTSLFNFYPQKNTAYTISIGAGGTSSGASGGTTTAFGQSIGGGGGGSNSIAYQSCTVYSTSGTAGNVYYYSSLSATAVSIGSGYKSVTLAYPTQSATHKNGTYLLKGYPSGYYRCNISSTDSYGYSAVNGSGGGSTYPFSDSSYASVSGTKGNSTTSATLYGQGGGGNSSSSFGAGKAGVVYIRNIR